MSYLRMLDRMVVIHRMTTGKDTYGSPTQPALTVIDTHPCAVTRKTQDYQQNAPAGAVTETFRLYFLPGADLRAGDLAIIPGYGKWRLGPPYNVRNHHLEVDGTWEGDA